MRTQLTNFSHPTIAQSENFLTLILAQFQIQGCEPNGNAHTGHPDPIIRSFYRSAYKLFTVKPVPARYLNFVDSVHSFRPGMDETFFINIWFRAIQYLFRQKGQSNYTHYNDIDWMHYFSSVNDTDLNRIKNTVLRENTATHVIERYRSLATAMRLAHSQHILDLGCSLGLGLKACLAPNYLCFPKFIDDTPGQQIINTLSQPKTLQATVSGLDIRIPKINWVKACNYPSKYKIDGQKIDQAQKDLSSIKIKIHETSLLNPLLSKIILNSGPPLDIVHSSLSMYELSSSDHLSALNNIVSILKPDGIFLEFTFIDPKDWFKGTHTVVRVNGPNGLQPPLEWCCWDNSRCTRVWSGKDFDQVNQFLLHKF